MRTTISIDDRLGERLRAAASRRGMSLSAFLAEAGRRHLEEVSVPTPAFQLLTRGGSGVTPGIDLDRAGALVVLDDERFFEKR